MGLREDYEKAKAEEQAVFDEMTALKNEWIDGGTQGEKPHRIMELEEKWGELFRKRNEKRDALYQGCTCGQKDCPSCGRFFSGRVRLPQGRQMAQRPQRHPGKPSIVIDRGYTTEVRNSNWQEPKQEEFNWAKPLEQDFEDFQSAYAQDMEARAKELAETMNIDRALDELAKGSLEQDMRSVGQDPTDPIEFQQDVARHGDPMPVFSPATEQVFRSFNDPILPDLSPTQQSQLGREPAGPILNRFFDEPANKPTGY